MIPALILYFIRKHKGTLKPLFKSLMSKNIVFKLLIILGLILITSSFTIPSENKSLSYNVVNNSKVIGVIHINKNISQKETVYTLSSNIKAKFLAKFNVVGKEKAIYKKGVLVYSSVYRTLNNKVKVNHSVELQGNTYHIATSNEIKPMSCENIKHNLVTFYFEEPKDINSVFCDNQKEMVPVIPVSDGVYKVEISKGKYNVFHYKKGKCIKVEAVSKLFSVTLIPIAS
ncbi:DUF6134 family protein [Aestuariivivens sp. NBU2969]|uniref:DUF6134 family protein n=1 Tax=Aestuariivivens sp. NBU2969 TaxID=2873267 RepID=UPI001CBE6C9F|nr:DUF6134 family protein [Aestuariivivens sp. NBU2969]